MPSKYLMTTITQTPLIELDRLRDFLKQIYGIDDCQITKLTGYDDLNFRIDDVKFNQNAHLELVQRNETTFIVKFTNPLENSNSYLLDGQIALMEHLRNHDIPSPIALPTVDGKLWKHVHMTDDVELPMRLFNFLPGEMLEKIGYNDEIFVLVGELLGKFHNATETFHHHSYDGYCHFLCMENWDSIEEEFELQVDQGILSDPRRIELCHKAINDLRKDVFDKRINFKPGFIHSDFNETNILLEKINEKEYKLSGLLDLGDFHYSLLIFDIATTILYLTFDSKINDWRNVAKHIVQGYTKNRKPYDLDYILVSMRARLASSLIYALRTSRINYRNEDMSYILKMQQNGWEFLEKLTVEYDQLPTFSAVIFT